MDPLAGDACIRRLERQRTLYQPIDWRISHGRYSWVWMVDVILKIPLKGIYIKQVYLGFIQISRITSFGKNSLFNAPVEQPGTAQDRCIEKQGGRNPPHSQGNRIVLELLHRLFSYLMAGVDSVPPWWANLWDGEQEDLCNGESSLDPHLSEIPYARSPGGADFHFTCAMCPIPLSPWRWGLDFGLCKYRLMLSWHDVMAVSSSLSIHN